MVANQACVVSLKRIYDGMPFLFDASTIHKLHRCLQFFFEEEIILKPSLKDGTISICLWIIEDILHYLYFTLTDSKDLKNINTRDLLQCCIYCQMLLSHTNYTQYKNSHKDSRIEFYLKAIMLMVSWTLILVYESFTCSKMGSCRCNEYLYHPTYMCLYRCIISLVKCI